VRWRRGAPQASARRVTRLPLSAAAPRLPAPPFRSGANLRPLEPAIAAEAAAAVAAALPFQLTRAQQRAVREVLTDMGPTAPKSMHRRGQEGGRMA
jgi:hypothetical protein